MALEVRKSVVLPRSVPSPIGTTNRWELREDMYGDRMDCVIYYVLSEDCPECGSDEEHKLDCSKQ